MKIPCFYKYYFGIPCPGCGMTRALISVLKLDFASALKYNPSIFIMPIIYAEYIFNGRLFKNEKINIAVFCICAASLLGVWICKGIFRL